VPASIDDLVVQQSFPEPRPSTNPYLVQLFRSLEETDGVAPQTFGWRRALRADYDIFHVHWPENLAKGSSPLKSFGRRALTRLLLARLRRKRIPIVRTMHNLDRPAGRSSAEYRVLDRIDRQTALVISLNEHTPNLTNAPNEVIVHGHYRDWFREYPKSSPVDARLAFFGLIRRYKNLVHLMNVHSALPREFSLRIGGKPSSPELSADIARARGTDERVILDLRFLTDAEIVTIVTESQLVVLPYTEMHNSGSVLAALSLDRPVLVKDNNVNRSLAKEVGSRWVQLYSGELEPEDVLLAYAGVLSIAPGDAPDLTSRNWDRVGGRHLIAYRRALEILAAR
jgi:beta-1,4-mannosyltransferase